MISVDEQCLNTAKESGKIVELKDRTKIIYLSPMKAKILGYYKGMHP